MCISGIILKLIALAVSNLGKSMCAVPSICTRTLWIKPLLHNFIFKGHSQFLMILDKSGPSLLSEFLKGYILSEKVLFYTRNWHTGEILMDLSLEFIFLAI